jgi:gliding motility-associated-like protein
MRQLTQIPFSEYKNRISGRTRRAGFLLFFLLFLFSPSESGAQTLYVADSNGNIFLVDIANCTSTMVVPASSFGSWFDIAVCSGNPNIIYGTDGSGNIYQIDVTTGIITLLNSSLTTQFPNAGAINSLVCDGNGNLYAASGDLYCYNIASNSWSYTGNLNGYYSGGDLTFYNGQLYMAGASNELVQINLSPFSVSLVGYFNATNSVFGVVTIGGSSLCGNQLPLTMLATAGQDIFTVNPSNGNCTAACLGLIPFGIFGAASLSEGINGPPTNVTATATDTTLCAGQNATLTASGAGSMGTYNWQPGNLSGNSVTVSPAVTTTYSVIGTDTSGCSDTAYVTLTVSPGLSLTGAQQNASCFGTCDGSATINIVTGTGPYNYSWTPAAPNVATANALCAGTVSCLVTDAGGCTDTQTFSITEPPAITNTIAIANDSCFGQCNGSASLTISGGTGSVYTYAWSPSGGNNSSASNLCAGNYSCLVTDSTGCTANIPVTITQPVLLTANTGTPLSICIGNNAVLSANPAGGTGPYVYSWQPGTLNSQNPLVTPAATTVYSITVTDANNCTANGTQTITVNPLPNPTFTASDSSGCAPLCVTFTSPTQSGDVCEWDFGDGNISGGNSPQNHCYTIPGTYSVSLTITDNNGCTSSITEPNLITVSPSPFASFTYSPDYITIYDPSVNFTDNSNGADQWFWDFGDTAHTTSTLQDPSFVYADTGCYNVTLTVTNLEGCADDTTQEVCVVSEFVIYVPNTFTPNGNGLNDVFLPVVNGYQEGSFHMMIFDRWGNLIFETKDPLIGWDGKVQDGKSGKVCQIDTYVWVIDVNEWNGVEHKYRGHVNLIH